MPNQNIINENSDSEQTFSVWKPSQKNIEQPRADAREQFHQNPYQQNESNPYQQDESNIINSLIIIPIRTFRSSKTDNKPTALNVLTVLVSLLHILVLNLAFILIAFISFC